MSAVPEYPTATMEGFVQFFNDNATGKQKNALLFALARIAKEHPKADPRLAVIEYLSQNLYAYEHQLMRYEIGST